VQLPLHSLEESHLVCVDLANRQARHLTPGLRRVVAVLQILGRQDESGQEHAATALQSPMGSGVMRLLHGEVMLGHVRLDHDEVVQGHLEGVVASTRPTQGLLDVGPEREHAATPRGGFAARRRSD
jgi:hypothetical protein